MRRLMRSTFFVLFLRLFLVSSIIACNAQLKENSGNSLLVCFANYSGTSCEIYTDPMASTNATANAVATAASRIPVVAVNSTISLTSDSSVTISSSYLSVTDADDTSSELTFTIRSIPSEGVIIYNSSTALGLNDTFTQSDINSGLLTYKSIDGETSTDVFKVTVADSDGNLPSGQSVGTSSTWTSINFSITNYCTGTKLTNAPFASASTGTSSDPHFICTATQLLAMDDVAGQADDYFELKTDLNLTAVNMGLGLFSTGTPFIGNFVGNFHTLSNMSIAGGAGDDYVGLFRSITSGAAINNLIFDTITVSGFNYVGGLAGYSENGNISKVGIQGTNTIQSVNNGSYIGGIVGGMTTTTTPGALTDECFTKSGTTVNAGTGSYAGGIVGYANQTAGSNNKVSSNYSLATVTGGAKVGGILGGTNGGATTTDLSKNYFAGTTLASVSTNEDGGIIGFSGANRENNLYDLTICNGASCSPVYSNARGYTTTNMNDLGLFLTFGFDFRDIWTMPSVAGYPILMWEPGAVKITTGFAAGSGTSSSPYEISTKNQLLYLAIRYDLWAAGKYFKLTANIDFLSGNFGMIGSTVTPFYGVFNGQGYKISDYTVYGNADEDNMGTFGKLGLGGVIKNLVLEDIDVIGSCAVGGVVGSNTYATISQVGLKGTNSITSSDNCNSVGGIVGTMTSDASGSAIIRRCFVKGTTSINGGTGLNVGGIVGNSNRNAAGTPIIENNYSTATVAGGTNVGGILGSENGSTSFTQVRYNYFAGTSTASSSPGSDGGVTGVASGTLTDNFYDSTVCAGAGCTGVFANATAETTADMKNVSTYPGTWDTATVWDFGFMPASYPQLLWETDTLPIL